MDGDWKAKLRRSVEELRENAARTAEVSRDIKASLMGEPRISRKEIEEAVEELSRALPSSRLVEMVRASHIPPASLKALSDIGISGGTLAGWQVRSRLMERGFVKERRSLVLTNAGRLELQLRGLPAEGMTDEELEQAEQERLARRRPTIQSGLESVLSDLEEAKKMVVLMTDGLRDMSRSLEAVGRWEDTFRRSVLAAINRGDGPGVRHTIQVGYTDDLPRDVVLKRVQAIAEDEDLDFKEELAPNMSGSGFTFRRRSPAP